VQHHVNFMSAESIIIIEPPAPTRVRSLRRMALALLLGTPLQVLSYSTDLNFSGEVCVASEHLDWHTRAVGSSGLRRIFNQLSNFYSNKLTYWFRMAGLLALQRLGFRW